MDLFKKSIKPMLLIEQEKVFNDKDYLYEIKFDGIRALLYIDSDSVTIKNRKTYDMTKLYPELNILKKIVGNKKCIFDGEIVVMDNGKPSFSKLQERSHLKDLKKIKYFEDNYPVTFVCFDILYENNDLTNKTLLERKKILSKYKDNDYFVKTKIFDDGIKLFKSVKKLDLEGIIAKKKNSTYTIGERVNDWIKIKNIKDDDYYIGGYLDKDDSFVISLLIGEYKDNKFKFVSKVTLGKKKDDYKIIKKAKVCKSKFLDFDNPEYTYIEPTIKCTVSFLEKTKSGHLRHPIFKNIKD